MKEKDPFTSFYDELLADSYDSVDRVVLNGYCQQCLSPGGFRNWWRALPKCGDENLDETHLMRMAGRFSRRLRGWAEKNKIPVIYCQKGDRKCDLAQTHRPENNEAQGIYVVFVTKVPTRLWKVARFGQKGINISRAKKCSFVNHYSFYIADPTWGHLSIKICGHPPFPAQIALNGHEYIERQALKKGLHFTKEKNCFTFIDRSSDPSFERVADSLCHDDAVGRLEKVCDRWIYRCLCFALDFKAQEKSGFIYSYTVYQAEYSRNLIFDRGAVMQRLFDELIDRNRSKWDLASLKLVFGKKNRPHCRAGFKPPRLQVDLKTPVYPITTLNVHFGRLGVKMYTKGESVLRIEATAYNTKALYCPRGLFNFAFIVSQLHDMVDRFLKHLQCSDISLIDNSTLEDLSKPAVLGKVRLGGLDLNKPRVQSVFRAAIQLGSRPNGFKVSELAKRVDSILPDITYNTRMAAYDLRKLRAKGLVTKLDKSRIYMPEAKGLRMMVGQITLRDKVLKPLLAHFGHVKRGPKGGRSRIEIRYQRIQREFRGLLADLHIMPYPSHTEAPEVESERDSRLHHTLRSLRPPRLIPRH